MIDVEGLQTTSARRYLRAVNAVFRKALREFDLADRSNPFASLTIVGEGNNSTPRVPFSREELQTLSRVCVEANDAHRWLLAMLIDTGCRLSEVAGLRKDDVSLGGAVPHLIIRPHLKLGRTLKNVNSERLIPLVGVSLWGAQRACAVSASTSGWLFPQYARRPQHQSRKRLSDAQSMAEAQTKGWQITPFASPLPPRPHESRAPS